MDNHRDTVQITVVPVYILIDYMTLILFILLTQVKMEDLLSFGMGLINLMDYNTKCKLDNV